MEINSTSTTTETTEVTTGRRRSWRDSAAWLTLEAVRPYLSWVVMIAMATFMLYQGQHDANAQNTISVIDLQRDQKALRATIDERRTERDKQIDGLQTKMLTREVFEAYHASDAQRMERIEKMMEQMLEHQTR
jgi:hypothetical protein